ncbi:shikimate dehydrogenase [Pectinatus sottacetonis]|uniref:shikimate dehydrogenase n=1 Tax=Pectinatus sottacetonis TaxID=1002795 RepID=UPI0018C7D1BC|nr:shikimate dehydrogenase [Pectinatus sottacetonis]
MSVIYTGKTKNIGVIGYPIQHSLSPVIQNTVLQNMDLDYAYIAMPVKKGQLGNAVTGLKALNFTGFNVTIPHKINIIPYLDYIDDAAKLIGAVNTVVIKDNKMYGYNTDHEGFINALSTINFSVKNKIAAVLGAGGAARAVIYSLLKAGVKKLYIGVRNREKAQKTICDFSALGEIHVYNWLDNNFTKFLSKIDLLVNTTPLGMYPYIEEMPPVDFNQIASRTVIYDIIYTPEKTKFLLEAEKNHNIILNGEYMLAGQGAAALQKWTGSHNIDIDLMRIALHKALLEKI